MDLEIEVKKSAGYCLVRVVGRMEVSEYEPAMNRLLDHPEMERGMPVVYDLGAADMRHLDANAFGIFAGVNERLAERRGRALVAIVVPDGLHFGLARMYEVLGASPNLEVQVFRDLTGAIARVEQYVAARREQAPES